MVRCPQIGCFSTNSLLGLTKRVGKAYNSLSFWTNAQCKRPCKSVITWHCPVWFEEKKIETVIFSAYKAFSSLLLVDSPKNVKRIDEKDYKRATQFRVTTVKYAKQLPHHLCVAQIKQILFRFSFTFYPWRFHSIFIHLYKCRLMRVWVFPSSISFSALRPSIRGQYFVVRMGFLFNVYVDWW